MISTPYAAAVGPDDGVLVVSGEIDELTVDAFGEDLLGYVAEQRPGAVVDLGGVTYLPSVAVSQLVVAVQQARTDGTSLELFAPEGTVAYQVLALCGIPLRAASP